MTDARLSVLAPQQVNQLNTQRILGLAVEIITNEDQENQTVSALATQTTELEAENRQATFNIDAIQYEGPARDSSQNLARLPRSSTGPEVSPRALSSASVVNQHSADLAWQADGLLRGRRQDLIICL